MYNDDWGGFSDGYQPDTQLALREISFNVLQNDVQSFCEEFSEFAPLITVFRDYLFRFSTITGEWEEVGRAWRGNRICNDVIKMNQHYVVRASASTPEKGLEIAKSRLRGYLSRVVNAPA